MNKQRHVAVKKIQLILTGLLLLMLCSAQAKAYYNSAIFYPFAIDTIPASMAQHLSSRNAADAFTFSRRPRQM